MKEHGPGGCVDGRPILWNSSDRLLCHSILETSGADWWDTMKAKNQSCMGFSSHLDHGPPFCFIFLGSVTTHHLFYSFNLKAAEAASTIVATA